MLHGDKGKDKEKNRVEGSQHTVDGLSSQDPIGELCKRIKKYVVGKQNGDVTSSFGEWVGKRSWVDDISYEQLTKATLLQKLCQEKEYFGQYFQEILDYFYNEVFLKQRDKEEHLYWAACCNQDANNILNPLIKSRMASFEGALDRPLTYGFDSRIPLHGAATYGHVDVVENLLSNKANINQADCNKSTPLMLAAENGHISVVRRILEGHEAPIEIDARDNNGKTALMLAAQNGHNDVMQVLVYAGADKEAVDLANNTPLILAVKNDRNEIVSELLAKKANVDAKDRLGDTPLIIALSNYQKGANDNTALIKLLVDHHANVNNPGSDDLTPYTIAIQTNNRDSADLLLDCGADINAGGHEGMSPLRMVARAQNREDVVWLVQDRGASVGDALYFSACAGDDVAISFLLDHCSKQNIHSIYYKIVDDVLIDETPLMAALKNNRESTIELLLQNGAEVDAPNTAGDTPLIVAIQENNNVKVIQKLITKPDLGGLGANIDAPDAKGRTPLMVALICQRNDMARCFVRNNANVNLADVDGNTALHHIASKKQALTLEELDDFELILRATDKIMPVNNSYLTPLQVANADNKQALKYIYFKVKCDRAITKVQIDVKKESRTYKNSAALVNQAIKNNNRYPNAINDAIKLLRNQERNSIPQVRAKYAKRLFEILTTPFEMQTVEKRNLAHLLAKKGADVNVKDAVGQTLLMLAIENGYTKIAKILIKEGADVNATWGNGTTLLLRTLEKAKEMLTQNNKQPDPMDSGESKEKEKEPDEMPKVTKVSKITTYEHIAHKLLVHEADVNKADHQSGKTAQHAAVELGDEEIYTAVISRAKTLDHKDNQGQRPMNFISEQEDVVKKKLSLVSFIERTGKAICKRDHEKMYKKGISFFGWQIIAWGFNKNDKTVTLKKFQKLLETELAKLKEEPHLEPTTSLDFSDKEKQILNNGDTRKLLASIPDDISQEARNLLSAKSEWSLKPKMFPRSRI